MSLRLARAGYCGGDPEKVMQTGADWVLAMMAYERFCGDYERAYIELNREKR